MGTATGGDTMLPPLDLHPVRMSEPHRRLMAAVLQTVLDDCHGSSSRQAKRYRLPIDPRDVRRAIAYVTSTDRAWPYSFENLCDALGLDAGSLRHKLQRESGAWQDDETGPIRATG